MPAARKRARNHEASHVLAVSSSGRNLSSQSRKLLGSFLSIFHFASIVTGAVCSNHPSCILRSAWSLLSRFSFCFRQPFFEFSFLPFLTLLIFTLSFSPFFASCHFIRAAWAAVFERVGLEINSVPLSRRLNTSVLRGYPLFLPIIFVPISLSDSSPFLFLAITSGGLDPPLPFVFFFPPFGSHHYLLLFRLALLARPMNSCQN